MAKSFTDVNFFKLFIQEIKQDKVDKSILLNCIDHFTPKTINKKYKKKSLLGFAIKYQDSEIVEEILNCKGIDLQSKIESWTPLGYSLKFDNTDIIELIVNHKSTNINALFEDDKIFPCMWTALGYAIHINKDIEVINMILSHENILPDIKFDNRTCLSMAIDLENVEAVKLLLSNENVNPNRSFYEPKWCPLGLAIDKENIEIVNLLLEHPDINVNLRYYEGYTCLFYALYVKQNPDISILLLKKKADIECLKYEKKRYKKNIFSYDIKNIPFSSREDMICYLKEQSEHISNFKEYVDDKDKPIDALSNNENEFFTYQNDDIYSSN